MIARLDLLQAACAVMKRGSETCMLDVVSDSLGCAIHVQRTDGRNVVHGTLVTQSVMHGGSPTAISMTREAFLAAYE